MTALTGSVKPDLAEPPSRKSVWLISGQPEARKFQMSDDAIINRCSIKHAYEQVVDAIATRIAAGYYPCKLPSERDLAWEFEVSYITVRHATAILRERGLIVSIHGRGTFVASELAGN
jgi:hypothetical protein